MYPSWEALLPELQHWHSYSSSCELVSRNHPRHQKDHFIMCVTQALNLGLQDIYNHHRTKLSKKYPHCRLDTNTLEAKTRSISLCAACRKFVLAIEIQSDRREIRKKNRNGTESPIGKWPQDATAMESNMRKVHQSREGMARKTVPRMEKNQKNTQTTRAEQNEGRCVCLSGGVITVHWRNSHTRKLRSWWRNQNQQFSGICL